MSITCGNTTAYHKRFFQTVALNLWRNSHENYTAFWESNWQPPQLTTLKVTDRRNESTKNWNNTFESLSTKDKMTGMNFSPSRNSNTTTISIPPPAKFHF